MILPCGWSRCSRGSAPRCVAEVEDSFGRIFEAVGADILPVESANPALSDVAAAIAASEEAWRRGEIPMQSWPGTAASNDG